MSFFVISFFGHKIGTIILPLKSGDNDYMRQCICGTWQVLNKWWLL